MACGLWAVGCGWPKNERINRACRLSLAYDWAKNIGCTIQLFLKNTLWKQENYVQTWLENHLLLLAVLEFDYDRTNKNQTVHITLHFCDQFGGHSATYSMSTQNREWESVGVYSNIIGSFSVWFVFFKKKEEHTVQYSCRNTSWSRRTYGRRFSQAEMVQHDTF